MLLNSVIYICLILILAKFIVENFLDFLNKKQVLKFSLKMPKQCIGVMDEQTYFKSVKYTLAKTNFAGVESIWESLTLALILIFGALPALYEGLIEILGSGIWASSLSFVLTLVILSVISIPLNFWETFNIETKFGFNKSSKSLWIADKIKELFLTIIISVPLVCLLLWFFQKFPSNWWILAFCAFFVFQITMMILYPRLILPIFNKLTPLEDTQLKQRLFNLAKKAGFSANSIFVIDGSKRSSHSNAYFTGFGKFRRIVIYDTLINQLEPAELEAVLAHEIGHYKKGHIPLMLGFNAGMLFLGFYLIDYFSSTTWFATSFGFAKENSMIATLLILSIYSGFVTFWTTPIFNFWMRKNEYEADDFSKNAMNSEKELISSLKKLHEKNLSNMTPHKLYSAFYYSHPTLFERQENLEKQSK